MGAPTKDRPKRWDEVEERCFMCDRPWKPGHECPKEDAANE